MDLKTGQRSSASNWSIINMGHGHFVGADPRGHCGRRQADQSSCMHQTRIPLCVQSHHWETGVAIEQRSKWAACPESGIRGRSRSPRSRRRSRNGIHRRVDRLRPELHDERLYPNTTWACLLRPLRAKRTARLGLSLWERRPAEQTGRADRTIPRSTSSMCTRATLAWSRLDLFPPRRTCPT